MLLLFLLAILLINVTYSVIYDPEFYKSKSNTFGIHNIHIYFNVK